MPSNRARPSSLPAKGPASPPRVRLDGIVNTLTGLGTDRDRTQHNRFTRFAALHPRELGFIYRGDGMGRRIINLPVREMIRQWITVEKDTDNLVLDELKRIKAKEKITDLLRWGRLYGGAIAIIGLDDGQEGAGKNDPLNGPLSTPLDEDSIQSVDFIHVFDRYQLWWTTQDLYSDPLNPKYQQPEWYTVTPYSGVANSQGVSQFRVHESRTLRVEGATIPEEDRYSNLGWGDSFLQAGYDAIRDVTAAFGGIANIVESFETAVIQISNLVDIIASGRDDELKKRLEILDYGRHILNTLLLAEGEQFEKKSSSVAGLADLLDRSVERVSGTYGIPATLLQGRSPAGLNATGASDIRFWYDNVKCDQEDELSPLLEPITKWVQLSKKGKFKGKEIEGWKIQYNPLWQLTETEEADLRVKQATVDGTYIDRGVLEPAEVAISRFGGDSYSTETTIDEAAKKKQLAIEQEDALKTPEEKAQELAAAGAPPDGGDNGGPPGKKKPEGRTEA